MRQSRDSLASARVERAIVGKLQCHAGSLGKSVVRTPWQGTDPNKRGSSRRNRRHNELRTFEIVCEVDAGAIGKRRFGQVSCGIVANMPNTSRPQISDKIGEFEFKSFPASTRGKALLIINLG